MLLCCLQAIAAWRDSTGYGRCQLVKQYFGAVAGFTPPEVLLQVPLPQKATPWWQGALKALPPALAKPLCMLASRTGQDPFYAVLAYKDFAPTTSGSSSGGGSTAEAASGASGK